MRDAESSIYGRVTLAHCAGTILCVLMALPETASTSPANGPACFQQLLDLPVQEQLGCVRSAALAEVPLSALIERLEASEGDTDHRVVAALLDRVRKEGKAANGVADAIAGLLPHQAALYQGRDKWHVLRLRAYVFATLSDIGVPESARPMLVDTLAYVDERMKSVEFGAAVRAAGTLGPVGREYIPYLLATISERFAEEEFSLDRYELAFPREEATTVQLETVRALAAIVEEADREAMTVLRAIAGSSSNSSLDSRLIVSARSALQTIEKRLQASADSEAGESEPPREIVDTLTPWLAPSERRLLTHLNIALEDHDGGEQSLSQLIDRPVLLTFFYTRCQNAGKCSTAVTRLAQLQHVLADQGLAEEVRLLALSFEPEFDTPVRLKRYALDRGLRLGRYALTGRLEVTGHAAFVDELDTPVSYSGGWVNTHGVESVLLDANGRLARKYTTLGWAPSVVLNDFQTLLAEQ